MKKYILLYVGILIYSLGSIMSKLASAYPIFSALFWVFYMCNLLSLAVYAVFWQKILKCFPLTTAFANRSLVMILTMLWGVLLFNEQITLNMVLGACIILFGLNLVVRADEQ